MSDQDVEPIVRKLMSDVFRTSVPENGEVERQAVPQWDSLKHVELMFSLEDEFGVRFEKQELGELNSLSAIVGALTKK